LESLLSLYDVSDFKANATADLSAEFYRAAEVYRDILLGCPNFLVGKAFANKCTSSAPPPNSSDLSAYSETASCPPVYIYIQNQTLFAPIMDTQGLSGTGIIHTSEFPYVFGEFDAYDTSGSTVYPSKLDYELHARQSRAWR
jgi:hypothetical protein